VTTEDFRERFVELEHRFWTALKQKDGAMGASLVQDPCLVVGAQGLGQIDKQTLAKMIENASYDLLDYSFEDMRVREIAPDVALVVYKVTEHLSVEGKQLTLEAFDSSVWVREGDGWLSALHTESPAGDPFGRK
jgi:hypothetical protein